MLALLAALQVASAQDSMPVVTLSQALEQAARLDPSYVSAAGQVNNAEWARRAAFAVFLVPAITLSANQTHYWPATFNFVTFTSTAPNTFAATIDARLDVFTGGQKFAGLASSGAALESAHAGELQARLTTAMNTESDFYSVLAQRALTRVADDRVHRARTTVHGGPCASDLGGRGPDRFPAARCWNWPRRGSRCYSSNRRCGRRSCNWAGASACRVRRMPRPCSRIRPPCAPCRFRCRTP